MAKKILGKNQTTLLVFLALTGACGFLIVVNDFWAPKMSQPNDTLTQQYGNELSRVLNHYFAVLQTEAAFKEPWEHCPEVATGREVQRCIITQGARTFHDNNEVVTIRVIEYQSDCALAIASFTSMGSVSTEVYLFWKVDDRWKIADLADAEGWGEGDDPKAPFGCS